MYDVYVNGEFIGIVYADTDHEAEDTATTFYPVEPTDHLEVFSK